MKRIHDINEMTKLPIGSHQYDGSYNHRSDTITLPGELINTWRGQKDIRVQFGVVNPITQGRPGKTAIQVVSSIRTTQPHWNGIRLVPSCILTGECVMTAGNLGTCNCYSEWLDKWILETIPGYKIDFIEQPFQHFVPKGHRKGNWIYAC